VIVIILYILRLILLLFHLLTVKLNGQSRTAFGLLKAPELQRLSVTVEVLRVGVMIVGVIIVGVLSVGVMTLSPQMNNGTAHLT
jgi:cell division protein FtsX